MNGYTIPREIILMIVKYYHTPATHRYYKRRIHSGYWWDATSEEHVILKVRKYDPNNFHVTKAKNLRLVCKKFAAAYDPWYIYTNIGGSFMVKAISRVVGVNSRISRVYVQYEAAVNFISEWINGKRSPYIRANNKTYVILCNTRMFKNSYLEMLPILEAHPMLLYNNSVVSSLLAPYQKKFAAELQAEEDAYKKFSARAKVIDFEFKWVEHKQVVYRSLRKRSHITPQNEDRDEKAVVKKAQKVKVRAKSKNKAHSKFTEKHQSYGYKFSKKQGYKQKKR
jgi:hypothetical protein